MARYRLNAVALKRVKKPGKVVDGSGLYFVRNKDATITPWQRVRIAPGKDRDVKVSTPYLGEVSTEWLLDVRRRAHALKTATPVGPTSTLAFSNLWNRYSKAVKRWNDQTRTNYVRRMEAYVAASVLWTKPIGLTTVLDIEDAIAKARQERPLLAPRLLLDMRNAFAWAISRNETRSNPAADYLESLRRIEHRPRPRRYPALCDLEKLRAVLAVIEASNLFASLRFALILQAYTAQRSGTVVTARWDNLGLAQGVWRIPRQNMKVADAERGDLVLAVHPTLAAILGKLPKRSQWVFPMASNPREHIGVPQIARAMSRLGFEGRHTPHGWRSALKTLADAAVGSDDRPLFAPRWTEDVLDHAVTGVQAHYSRARAEEGMKRVLLWWGDLLAAGSEVPELASASQ
jgi:integrase